LPPSKSTNSKKRPRKRSSSCCPRWPCGNNTEPKLIEIRPDAPAKEGEGEEEKKEGEGEEEQKAVAAVQKEASENGEGEANPQGEAEGAEAEGEDDRGEQEEVQVEFSNEAYTEMEYALRNPPEDYEKIKELEDRILEFKKQGIRTYVV